MNRTGLEVGTWVRIEDDCPIEYVALREEVEMSVGGRYSGFDLVFSERGLETLIAAGKDALAALRERMATAHSDDE